MGGGGGGGGANDIPGENWSPSSLEVFRLFLQHIYNEILRYNFFFQEGKGVYKYIYF